MSLLTNLQERFFQNFLDRKLNALSVTIFCKALVVFVVVKIIMIWEASTSIVTLHEFVRSPSLLIRIVFFPAYWASHHLTIFYLLSVLFLVTTLFVRWNYLIGVVFFLLVFNLFRVNISINNGADHVLFMLAFWTIGMSLWPVIKNERWNTLAILLFNVSVFLCQLQLVFIYFASGWDKLMSEVWRSGDAMNYIIHIDYMFNSYWFGSPNNHILNLTLSWMTILFELAFATLVWIKRTRLVVLGIGVGFHLVIWLALSMPDFGLVMMISYLVFLKDTDYATIRKKITLKPL